jgi:hypothetical protein
MTRETTAAAESGPRARPGRQPGHLPLRTVSVLGLDEHELNQLPIATSVWDRQRAGRNDLTERWEVRIPQRDELDPLTSTAVRP